MSLVNGCLLECTAPARDQSLPSTGPPPNPRAHMFRLGVLLPFEVRLCLAQAGETSAGGMATC